MGPILVGPEGRTVRVLQPWGAAQCRGRMQTPGARVSHPLVVPLSTDCMAQLIPVLTGLGLGCRLGARQRWAGANSSCATLGTAASVQGLQLGFPGRCCRMGARSPLTLSAALWVTALIAQNSSHVLMLWLLALLSTTPHPAQPKLWGRLWFLSFPSQPEAAASSSGRQSWGIWWQLAAFITHGDAIWVRERSPPWRCRIAKGMGGSDVP